MSIKVFISYRRQDSIATAGRIHDRMVKEFGRNNVFMDVDSIPVGVDFVAHLNESVARSDVFLAIIGPNWVGARVAKGESRPRNGDDFVVTEIAAALDRNVRVVPVLVDGAAMPRADELPERLLPLARRNAIEVRNTQFHADADRLIEKVREGSAKGQTGKLPLRVLISAPSAILLIIGCGVFIFHLQNPSQPISEELGLIHQLPQVELRQLPTGFAASDFRVVDRAKPPDCEESPPPEPVPIAAGGYANLALLKEARASASSVIPGYPKRHQTAFLIDGWYNNCRSWIPAAMPAWAAVDLGEPFELHSVKLGSEHTRLWGDRAPTAFSIATKLKESDDWSTFYEQEANRTPLQDTTEFLVPGELKAQYVRIQITATADGKLPRLDEIEVYGRRN